jgi:hypothetical protein
MNQEDKLWWTGFRQSTANVVSKQEFNKICELHAQYFNHELYKPCTCNSKKVQRWIDDLNKLYFGN